MRLYRLFSSFFLKENCMHICLSRGIGVSHRLIGKKHEKFLHLLGSTIALCQKHTELLTVARLIRFEGKGHKKFPKGPPFAYVSCKNFERVPPLLRFFEKISKKFIKGGGGILAFSLPFLDLTAWPPVKCVTELLKKNSITFSIIQLPDFQQVFFLIVMRSSCVLFVPVFLPFVFYFCVLFVFYSFLHFFAKFFVIYFEEKMCASIGWAYGTRSTRKKFNILAFTRHSSELCPKNAKIFDTFLIIQRVPTSLCPFFSPEKIDRIITSSVQSEGHDSEFFVLSHKFSSSFPDFFSAKLIKNLHAVLSHVTYNTKLHQYLRYFSICCGWDAWEDEDPLSHHLVRQVMSFTLGSQFSLQILLDDPLDSSEADLQLSGNRSRRPGIGTVDEIFHFPKVARRTRWMQAQFP